MLTHFLLPAAAFAIPLLISVIYSIVLLRLKGKRPHHIYLTAGFLCMALSMFTMLLYMNRPHGSGIILDIVSIAASLSVSPTYYLYVRSLAYQAGVRRRDFLIFIPAAIVTLANIILIPIMGIGNTAGYFELYQNGVTTMASYGKMFVVKFFCDSILFRTVNLVQTLAILIFSSPEIGQYEKVLERYYSNKGETFISPEKLLKWFGLFALTALVLLSTLPFSVFRNHIMMMVGIGVCLSGALAAIGHHGMRIGESASEFYAKEREEAEKLAECRTQRPRKEESTDIRHRSELAEGLQRFVENKEYLNPDISLVQLSEELKSNRLYVAEAIKEVYDDSFCGFVNQHRVEYAKELIRSSQQDKISFKAIALSSGYNSVTNFYRNFVRFTGVSPTEWAARLNAPQAGAVQPRGDGQQD